MKSGLPLLGLLVPALLGAAVPTVAGDAAPVPPKSHWIYQLLPKAFQPNPQLELTVVTELTDAGRKLPPVSPQHPVYFQPHSTGFKQIGDIPAGAQPLAPEEIERLLFRALSANGYLPARLPEQVPTLVIVYGWGSHNMLDVGMDENPVLSPEEVVRNVLDRAALVGGDKFAKQLLELFQQANDLNAAANAQLATDGTPPISPGLLAFANPVNLFRLRDAKNEFLLNQASGDVYYVVASAYDYRSVAENRRILLWRTRMTVGARGLSQVQSFPTLVQSAAPFFGKETAGPEIMFRPSVRAGNVEVGTPTVVGPAGPAGAPPVKK